MKTHHYQITIQETEDRHGAVPGGAQALCFAAESHDDWDDIVRRIKQQALFDEASATQFAIGLKLLGGVMLAHRERPLFAEFAPHFGQFMRKLKGKSSS